MKERQLSDLHQKIDLGVKKAISDAIERHRKLGESIAIWRDGKVVILTADEIPGQGDYTEERHQWLKEKSLEELYKEMEELPEPNSNQYDQIIE